MRCSNTRPDIIINHLVNTVRFVVHEKQLLALSMTTENYFKWMLRGSVLSLLVVFLLHTWSVCSVAGSNICCLVASVLQPVTQTKCQCFRQESWKINCNIHMKLLPGWLFISASSAARASVLCSTPSVLHFMEHVIRGHVVSGFNATHI